MKKRYRHVPQNQKLMRRSARVYLNDLNVGKAQTLIVFLRLCHDVMQYFVDLFWRRQDISADLADLQTVHGGRDRFGITTRLAQALAKQAKECIRSAMKKATKRKPRLRHHTVTLYYHFVTIEPFTGKGFDYAIRLIGSGAPRMVIPVHATNPLNQLLATGWQLAKTLRLGRRGDRLFVEFIVEKPRPALKTEGRVVGMDSNYKHGFVFSDDQVIGDALYTQIQTFQTRQKHTHTEIQSLLGHALKHLDLSQIRLLSIENLKHVKSRKRGTFSRVLNRRLSHWLYAYLIALLERRCEEAGVRLERKAPAYTSQFCRRCWRWDRRNRVGDRFCCVHCGYTDHADHNAAKTLELLGEAGVYGLRSLLNLGRCSKNYRSK